MTPRRLSATAPELPATLDLLRRAFACMEGRIDPPSSLTRMDLTALTHEAAQKELWILPGVGSPAACMILTPQVDALYIGKLAVAEKARGQGLARQLLDLADSRARALGLPRLRLQTRVELTENHATFTALGFAETARTSHPGYDRPTSLTYERPVQEHSR
ncbi:GNAT family N-acetyltransferase [Pseudooceanicola algae]|uniref:Uncharacterized protein n=1 Tax=Pseudooceanicola algae TaxID=1537215 RepID=A0A418SDD1_9RHOB|nr:GNAT family N-acetyltransferase [Pseudooceanicola algae]QPM91048.1 hypothetical protein PSAL_022910 [Pseudooceanicola algae]